MPKFSITPVASSIPFDNDNIKFNADEAQAAIEEIRSNEVKSFDKLTSTLNGNHNIEVQDANVHAVSGTATGYSVTLPDATQLFVGRRFEINNESDETVNLKDNDGTVLRELVSGDIAICTLEANGGAAGTWVIAIVSGSATGIISYVVTSDTTFTTSSITDVEITSFETTPVSGRYSVTFSSEVKITQQNRIAEVVVDVAGTPEENTRRKIKGIGNNFETNVTTVGEVTVNGSQAVKVKVNVSGGSLDVEQRSLVLIRLGS